MGLGKCSVFREDAQQFRSQDRPGALTVRGRDRPSGSGRPARSGLPVAVAVARIPPVLAVAVSAMAVVAVAIPAIPIVGSIVVAVVMVAVPRYCQGAAPSVLIKSADQARRAGLSRRRNKADRKSTEAGPKKRLHCHKASPLVLGLFPGISLLGELPVLRGATAAGFLPLITTGSRSRDAALAT